jgi:hypothetical protein
MQPWDGEPHSSEFELREILDVGVSVISRRQFDVGDRLFVFSGQIINRITLRTLRMPGGQLHLHDEWFMGYVAHSCEPNCYVDMERLEFQAIRPIAPGDLVTMDYMQTETELFRPFDCCCGTPSCRGRIGDPPTT